MWCLHPGALLLIVAKCDRREVPLFSSARTFYVSPFKLSHAPLYASVSPGLARLDDLIEDRQTSDVVDSMRLAVAYCT